MKLNNFQASLILKTKVKASTSEVWLRFDGEYSYPYINQGLNLLKKMEMVTKEYSTGKRKEVYYQATKEAIEKAKEVLNEPAGEDGPVVEETGADKSQMSVLQEHDDGSDSGD